MWMSSAKSSFCNGDGTALRTQLSAQRGQATAADQLAVSLLYLRAFGDRQATLEVQMAGGATETANREGLIATLDAMQVALQESAEEIVGEFEGLEPRILALQEEVQALATEEERLRQEVTLAMETYTALTRQVSEEKITSQDTSRGLLVAGRAVVPEESVAPRPLLNGVLAAVVALAGVVVVTVGQQWQRS
jgi:hypothetical protein